MKKQIQLASSQQYQEEATLLKKVTQWLEPQVRDGIKVIRVVDRYNKGYSDLFINARGRLVCAELKDDTGTASPHQELFIEEIEKSLGVAGVCRSVLDVKMLLDKALYCSCYFGTSIKSRTPASPTKKYLYCPMCGREIKRDEGC